MHEHFARQCRKLGAYYVGGKLRKESRFKLGSRSIHPDFDIRGRGQQQEAIVGDATGTHVIFDNAGCLADRIGQIRAVRANDQGHIGYVHKVKSTADANHPFAMFNIQRTRCKFYLCNVIGISQDERQ